jgi:hypothetical protein
MQPLHNRKPPHTFVLFIYLLRIHSLSTWAIVLALLAGGTYFTYLSFFPAPKSKSKLRVKTAATSEKADTPVTPGSGALITRLVGGRILTMNGPFAGVYNEEWIPAHHMKKTKSGKKDGVVSSGDESDRKRKR